jgi:cation diffusion facilitator family transporter
MSITSGEKETKMSDQANHQEQQNDQDHEDGQEHPHSEDWQRWIQGLFHLWHSHDHKDMASEQAFINNKEGIRTVWLALGALTLTSILQFIIVYWSGSVALLADTFHNIGDGLNSIPLLIAFYLARRAANRRYTYGYGRAEDIAGIFIVLSIALSAGLIFWESVQKLIDPQPLNNLGWVAVASILGFLGNEAVALLQIRTGRRIGSAALVTDGLHARTDGLTSLAVFLAAGGSWLGFPILDPIIGLLIGIAILYITRDATVSMWYRLMDAIEPKILEKTEVVIRGTEGVKELHRLRMRWIGHSLHAEITVAVDAGLTTTQSHQIVEELRHDLFHQIDKLTEIVVQVDPWGEQIEDAHQLTSDHEPIPSSLPR